jgi:hypothetical protein
MKGSRSAFYRLWIPPPTKRPPTTKVDMYTLNSNPAVVRIRTELMAGRQFTGHDLAVVTGIPLHQLAPVLREMQRARMITAGKIAVGTSTIYYQIKE